MAQYNRHETLSSDSEVNDEAFLSSSSNVWFDTDANRSYTDYLAASFRSEAAGNNDAQNDIMGQNTSFSTSDRPTDIVVAALPMSNGHKFKGKKTVWPGALFLLLLIAGGLAALTYFGIQERQSTEEQQDFSDNTKGRTAVPLLEPKKCKQLSFQTSGLKLMSVSPDGKTETEFQITGVNWSGMENPEGVPHGLAFRQSSLRNISALLAKHKINAVRLPLNAMNILEDTAPNVKTFVDPFNSPELVVKSYMEMIQQIVQGLAQNQIGVLLDIHKLDPEFLGGGGEDLWYSNAVTAKQFGKSVEMLAEGLCGDDYWNIIGLDLKNEPSEACWPSSSTDTSCDDLLNWQKAASEFGNAVLKKCKQWVIFVEGVYDQNKNITIGEQEYFYNDWEGASLNHVATNPVVFRDFGPDKIVYSPHFYSPSVYPTSYYFQASDVAKNEYKEFPSTVAGNASLKATIHAIMDEAFGSGVSTSSYILGEFGGIFGEKDALNEKTSTRAILAFMDYIKTKGLGGGFVWSLNPDSDYDFNGVYSPTKGFKYGIAEPGYKAFYNDYATSVGNFQTAEQLPCFKKP